MEQTFETYKAELLSYLKKQKRNEEEDIEANRRLSPSEKEELGIRIRNAEVVEIDRDEYKIHAEVNNSKLRPGDKVTILFGYPIRYINAIVLENFFNELILQTSAGFKVRDHFDIEVSEVVMLQSIISLIDSIEEGNPGSFFLKELAGIEEPYEGLGAIPFYKVTTFPESLNPEQFSICEDALQRPTISCVQGPPGTGKTDVLATIANTFSDQGMEVLILSLTHQAVNNALNKVKKVSRANVIKVGQLLKAEDLSEDIVKIEKYGDYVKSRKENRKSKKHGADILGMTIHTSIMNLGLKKSGFNPSVILVDESSQIPITLASTIGAIGCGSVIFFGDDKQMPPIFHQKLKNHQLSQSVFSHLCALYPSLKRRLTTTYRMNEEITEVVSRNFYEPFGEKLVASEFSRNRRLDYESGHKDLEIRGIFNDAKSIITRNPTKDNTWEDENPEEAAFIAKVIEEALKIGMKLEDLAVITPYRRQVKAIRTCVFERLGTTAVIPIIDTVERLQGQDVDMVIVSLCISSPAYFIGNQDFLFNKNRLNVMISRAKKKVLILGSKIVLDNINLIMP